MATLNINGQEVEVPDDLTPAELELIKNDSAQPVAQKQEEQPGMMEKLFGTIDPATLANDDDWLKASNDLYKASTGKDFNGTADDLSEYGLDSMGWFNYNLPKMLVDANRLRNMTDEQKQSFLYMMDTYDNLKVSWSGAGRFVTAAAADPSNWVGLSTFGFSTLATQGGKAIAKAGVKDILKGAVKTGVVTAIENGIQAGAQSAVRQQAEANAGRGDGIELGRTVTETAIGAGAGFILGTAGSAAGGGVRKVASRGATEAPAVPATGVADEAVPPASGAPSPATEASQAVPPVKPVDQAVTLPEAANDNLAPSPVATIEEPKVDATAPPKAANENVDPMAQQPLELDPVEVEMAPGQRLPLKSFSPNDPQFTPPANDAGAVTDFVEARDDGGSILKGWTGPKDVDDLFDQYPDLAANFTDPYDAVIDINTWKTSKKPVDSHTLEQWINDANNVTFFNTANDITNDPRWDVWTDLATKAEVQKVLWQPYMILQNKKIVKDERGYVPEWIKEKLQPAYDKYLDISDKAQKILEADPRQSATGGLWTDYPYKTGVPTYVDAYHGTSRVFEKFDTGKLGSATSAQDSFDGGWFFSRGPETAEGYATEYPPKFSDMAPPEAIKEIDTLSDEYNALYRKLYEWRTEEEKKNPNAWVSQYDAANANPDIKKRMDEIDTRKAELRDEYGRGKANIFLARLKFENPLVVDRQGSSYSEDAYVGFIKQARQDGHDGIILVNVLDGGPLDTTYIVLKENTDKAIRFKMMRDEQKAASQARLLFVDESPLPVASANDNVEQLPKALGSDVPTKETVNVPSPANENAPEIKLGNPANETSPPVAANVNTPEKGTGGSNVAEQVLTSLRSVIENNGLTMFPRTREEFAAATKVATDILSKVHPDDVREAVDTLIRAETDPARHTALLNTIQRASAILEEQVHDMTATVKTLKGAQATAARQQLEMAKNIRDTIKGLDTAMSSQSGYGLGNRVGEFNVGNRRDQFASEDAYLQSQGIEPTMATPEERQMAEDAYFKAYEDWKNSAATNGELRKLEAFIEDAARKSDFTEVNKLMDQRTALLDELAKNQLEKQGIASQILKGNIARGFMEYVIGTVFTTGSFVVNTIPSMVKTVYRPALDGVVEGLDTAARRKMAATYSAMLSNVDGALKAAYLSLRYEKTFMTDDVSRMIEAPDGVIPGNLGRAIRFLPNLLNATDVFFMQLNYRGFVAGEATARAYERGLKMGMKGNALDTYVKSQVNQYIANSFSPSITDVGVLDAIRKQGASKGLYGKDLDKWMKLEMAKNQQYFAEATHQGGIDFVKDLTFKKEFSKNGLFSSVADAYEKTVAREPLIKLMGQLFFRTPVRVFQEGFRLTPVLGLVTPTRMLGDLMGKNGKAMQTKAMGELLLSQAIMGSFAVMYAKQQLSGGGSFNYKERQAKENAKEYEPYTLTFDDGFKFSYRNLDPFSTPFKIMSNVMDRLQMLQYRRSQGEYVDDEEKYVYQVATAALVSVAQAVRDANLTEGINSIVEAGQKFSDPNSDGTFLPKLIFQKIQLVVPNMIRKGIQTNEPTLTDPLTWEQNARNLINPGDPLVPKRYDSLGNVVKAADPSDAYVGVRTTTKAQREKGLNEKQLAVLSSINDLEVTNGTYLTRPYKHQMFGDTDLRRELTADGKETKYDRIMREYNKSDLTDRLYDLFVEQGYTSVGTPRQHDAVFDSVKNLMDGYWDMAAAKVAKEDLEAFRQRTKHKELDKADVLRGKHAVPPPF